MSAFGSSLAATTVTPHDRSKENHDNDPKRTTTTIQREPRQRSKENHDNDPKRTSTTIQREPRQRSKENLNNDPKRTTTTIQREPRQRSKENRDNDPKWNKLSKKNEEHVVHFSCGQCQTQCRRPCFGSAVAVSDRTITGFRRCVWTRLNRLF